MRPHTDCRSGLVFQLYAWVLQWCWLGWDFQSAESGRLVYKLVLFSFPLPVELSFTLLNPLLYGSGWLHHIFLEATVQYRCVHWLWNILWQLLHRSVHEAGSPWACSESGLIHTLPENLVWCHTKALTHLLHILYDVGGVVHVGGNFKQLQQLQEYLEQFCFQGKNQASSVLRYSAPKSHERSHSFQGVRLLTQNEWAWLK